MSKFPFDYARSTALVTGASRGIGAEISRELARRGVPTIVLTARSLADLDELADELRRKYGTRAETIVADLADPSAPLAIRDEVARRGLTVDLLVNNAGFGDHGPFDARDLQKQTRIVEVNVESLVALTGLFLPGMVDRKTGGILNVASTAGFQPVPYMATYGATKAFVLSFSEALWSENIDRQTGVRVVCLCPGGTATEFGTVATEGGSPEGRGAFENTPQSTPLEVAKAGLDALDRNASFAVPGALNYAGTFGARLLPRAALARMTATVFRPADVTVPSAFPSLRRTVIASVALAAGLTAATVVLVRHKRFSHSS